MSGSTETSRTPERLRALDALRGFSVLSMVAFHATYDVAYIFGMPLPWFEPPFQDIWRNSISWTFLLIAGWMCLFSRNNFRRAARYLAVALAVFAVTTLAGVDTPISFGVIFCMGASALLYALLELAGIPDRVGSNRAGALTSFCALFLLFLLCLNVPKGYLSLPWGQLILPEAPYSCGYFSWLGFPGPGFSSGDYYPIIPFTLLFLAGGNLGRFVMSYPQALNVLTMGCAPLEFVGRHALEIYVIHQPVVLLLLNLVFR